MTADNDFFGIQHAVQQQRPEVEPSSSRTSDRSGNDFFDEAFFPEVSKNPRVQPPSNDVVDQKVPESGTEYLDNAFFPEVSNRPRFKSSSNDTTEQQVPQSGTEYLDEAFFGNRARNGENQIQHSQNSPNPVTPRRSKIEVIDSPYIQIEDFTGFDKLNSLIEPVWKYSSKDLVSLLAERVIYDGDDIIAFDKPYQMAYASGPKSQPQLDRILQDLKEVVAPKVDRLYVIKSLDKACSGVIMFAKSADLQKKYQEMIQKGRIEFEYRTIVKNVPQKPEACINIPLVKFSAGQDFEMRPLVRTTKDKVYYVKTNYDTIESNNRDHCAYLRVNLNNEIPHQVRSHLGYGIGCPVLGDKKYNNVGQKSPQTLSAGILSKFQMKQSQVHKMPMFMHLKEIHIDGATTRHRFNASIRAPTPDMTTNPVPVPQCSSAVAIPNSKKMKKKLSKEEAQELYDKLVLYHPAFRMSVRSAKLAENFAKKVMFLEKNMWELSTLGGAYAAMSMYGSSFGEKLMDISKAQYVVAKELGSEIYQSRARIYISNALATNGLVDRGLMLIGSEVKYLKEELKDNFNLKMALAMATIIKRIKKKQNEQS